ncbi:MAG: cyclic nucleotide-binding domain-containing protein [Pseudomonadota bacterium]
MRAEIAGIDHFSGLSAPELDRLLEGAELRSYGAGDTILDPEHSQAIYSFLVRGKWWMARQVIGTDAPREWIDDRPGNWHGGIALIDKIAPPQVRAETDCTVLHVPRDLLDDLAAGNAHLALAMLRGVRGGATMLHKHATGEG